LATDIDVSGEWSCRNGSRVTLEIEGDQIGQWRVTFHSSTGRGHGKSVRLERLATCKAEVLTLDRPVQHPSGTMFQRVYTVRVHGQEYLVPSDRLVRLTRILETGDATEQTIALQGEMLVRYAIKVSPAHKGAS